MNKNAEERGKIKTDVETRLSQKKDANGDPLPQMVVTWTARGLRIDLANRPERSESVRHAPGVAVE